MVLKSQNHSQLTVCMRSDVAFSLWTRPNYMIYLIWTLMNTPIGIYKDKGKDDGRFW